MPVGAADSALTRSGSPCLPARSNSRTHASTGHASAAHTASTAMPGNSCHTAGNSSRTTIRVNAATSPSTICPSSAVGTTVPGNSCAARAIACNIFVSPSMVSP